MNFNKWRNYLTESRQEIDEMEVTGKLNMDGKVVSNKTPKGFKKGTKVKHPKMGSGVVKVPDAKKDFVIVNFDGQDRMVPYSELTISGEKSEKDEKVLDETCGVPSAPVMMPEPVGGDQSPVRHVEDHDQEGRMAKSQLYKITKYAMEIMENLHDDDELESWVQAKITKAASYMSAAKHYLEYEYKNPSEASDVAPVMESAQKKVDEIVERVESSKKNIFLTTEAFRYHVENKVPITENVFRVGSESYVGLFKEAKQLWKEGKYEPTDDEKLVFETDLGEWGTYNGQRVPLDCPLMNEVALNEAEYKGKKVSLGKPSRGGSKKFYVYVKCGAKGRVRKISFGAKGMSLKLSDPARRRSFVARHRCKQKNDRCTAGYWACRIGRYPNLTGAKKRYTWW
jgi:hypothetical protein